MDTAWLASEAKMIHQIFANYFYILVGTLILVGVVLDYFKFAIGQTPQFASFVGRAFVAGILLIATPEIMNMLASFTDSLAKELGDLNQFKYVLSRMGDKVGELSWSWVSFKESVILLISFLTFFILYITVHLADSFFLFTWMLLYVFSPILIAMYVLPVTASATTGLFRAFIEVSSWKIVWSVLASLLWSMALSEINKPEHNISFLSVVVLNIMLVFSIVITPKITSVLVKGGLAQAASSLGGAMLGAAALTPTGMSMAAKMTAKRGIENVSNRVNALRDNDKNSTANKYASKAHSKQKT
ncbi:MAG: hypothetical protein IPM57_02530 [Oligoflexia bacterium]|nr:hypothetical protein [Oligoflexia bacterium]